MQAMAITARPLNSSHRLDMPMRAQAVNPINRMALCFAPIFDKNIGCASPDQTQKLTCLNNVLGSVMECAFFGQGEGTYIVDRKDDHINCIKTSGYTRDEAIKLNSCANTNGYVTNNACTAQDSACPTTVDEAHNPSTCFCNCNIDNKIRKIWNPMTKSCVCDPDGLYSKPSRDGKCCTNLTCNNLYQFFDCNTQQCECDPPYVKITEGPDAGKCYPACVQDLTQNNSPWTSDPTYGGPGCGSPIALNGQQYPFGDLYIATQASPADMCCGSAQKCVLDNPPAKASCLGGDNIWAYNAMATCPRGGACYIPSCGSDWVNVPPLWLSSCNADLGGGKTVSKCNTTACSEACTSKCDSLGSTPKALSCDASQICQCECNSI